MEREIKTAKDVRVLIAEYDIPVGKFAERAGIENQRLSNMLHGRAPLTDLFRKQIEAVAKQLDDNPPPPVEAPDRQNRLPEVRLSQL